MGWFFFVGVQCGQWGQWLIVMVVTIHNGGCQQWWYVFFLVFVMFLIHHVCCVFELLLGVFSNLCSNFWSSCSLCFCVWTLGHHMLHCPTLVFNYWSSCSWCSYFSVWFWSCASSWSLCYLSSYFCAWAFGCCVLVGFTWVLELLVIVFFMVLP
jgi:hypothetical protein